MAQKDLYILQKLNPQDILIPQTMPTAPLESWLPGITSCPLTFAWFRLRLNKIIKT